MAHRLNWQMPELELLNSLFSPPLTKSILSMKVYREERSFYWVVKECAQRLSKTNLDLTSPTSVQHFLSVMEPILSRTAKEQIADNIAYFNYICESDLKLISVRLLLVSGSFTLSRRSSHPRTHNHRPP